MTDILTIIDDHAGERSSRDPHDPEPTLEASDEALAAARTGALAERVFALLLPATELFTIELGRRLGLYEALRHLGPTTAPALAAAAGIAPRYAREWLEQQAAAGYLETIEPGPFQPGRRFVLPAEHMPVLLEEEHPAHVAPVAGILAGIALAFPELVEDFRIGRGVAFDEYGTELRRGIAGLNRPAFVHEIRAWIEAIPDAAAALDAGGSVLDAGCGVGWSTVAIATAFPSARIVGIDLDADSIDEARANAAAAGVADRVEFVLGNASDAVAIGGIAEAGFDLVTVFEALHDMGRPVEALDALRGVLAPGASVLVADERVGETFTADAEPFERLAYAISVLHCLPATTAESPAVANGTVLRPATLRAWAAAAGFGEVEDLPIENPFWRFWRLA